MTRMNPWSPTPSVGEHAVHCLDLRKEAPQASNVHVVLADPPWYEDETRAFLHAAALICAETRVGVVGCGLPKARDQGVVGEQERVWSRPLRNQVSRYWTPNRWRSHTSRLSLSTTPCALPGSSTWSPNWRRGDLMIFREDKPRRSGSAYPNFFSGSEWIQVDIPRDLRFGFVGRSRPDLTIRDSRHWFRVILCLP